MDRGVGESKWPKLFPPLSPEQRAISDDFTRHWHEVLPRKYGYVDEFNHRYVVGASSSSFSHTLEVGAGSGEHLTYESLTAEQRGNYVAVDIRENMVAEIRRRFPLIRAIVADCQAGLDFPDGHFDRILAIHVLEHLPDLPAAVAELHRLCHKSRGVLSMVIPCEGSLAYGLARRVSARRIFEKRYKSSYNWYIEREHINRPQEIFAEITPYFELRQSTYFPLPLKYEFCNLCIGATFVPRVEPLQLHGGP
jgi:ubiquinone/menaquinone biosynthesis C-methylase UbiE